MIAGFKGYLYLTTRDESANWLMLYIKKQTTPLWYVSRLRPAFIAPTGEPIRAPSVSYIAGKRPMLVEQHLARAFRGADKYEFRLVTLPAAVSRPISVNDLQSYRIGTLRRTMELIKFVKDKAAAYAVFIVVQTDYDIDESIYSFWTTEFASLPAHLLVLRAREDEQSLEGEQVEEVQSAARPFIPAEDNPPHSIASLAYLTEDEEAKQDDWIFYIEDTYEGWQEKRGRVLRVSLE